MLLKVSLGLLLAAAAAHPVSLPRVLARSGAVVSASIPIKALDAKHQYGLLYSISPLRDEDRKATVKVEVLQGVRTLASKTLHTGDPDFYTQFRTDQRGPATVRVTVAGRVKGRYSLEVNEWPLSRRVRSGPIDSPQRAMSIDLGTTVFASGDDANYIPLEGSPRKAAIEAPADWYKFEFKEPKPKLVHFVVDLTERDQLPVSVYVHRMTDGKVVEYFEGEDPVSLPHEVQALPGNKFTPRILKEAGTYLIAVRANHPEYKLRTRVYEAPPYNDPVHAVQTGVDYSMFAGDSWHANTPRRGGILDRTESVHQETSLCVACHVTHFSQRGQLYAARKGYEVNARQQLQFMTERFYNNPRPLYGFEQSGAVWARMISAPANVLSRMSHLLSLFENNVSGERRQEFHNGIAEYLKLYYKGRDKLPGDETNGNTPLVSAHEVAWYSWSVTRDPKLPELIASGEVKNTIDLCYQTLVLADIDAVKYQAQIAKNAEKLLSLQREDGQWSARFEASQPAVEFQTGHALWALQSAGIPVDHPQVAKAIRFLLSRQQAFGGWMDPLQSFENFRTPFRETQMAVLALSAYYPKQRAKGWNSRVIERLSDDPVYLLEQLDSIWDQPPSSVIAQIENATTSNDVLIRQAAVEALGRLARAPRAELLGDPSKLVQRTAAWATRQAHVRHPDLSVADVTMALTSKDDRTRWGAARIFAAHFASLARRSELPRVLMQVASSDPSPMVRMDSVRGLWQSWFWTRDAAIKSAIEDAVLAALAKPENPWVAANLRHATYNLADENIRYLYNNWVPALPTAEDRERAIAGRLSTEDRLGAKFARVLESGSAHQKKELLRALTQPPLRRGDIYNLTADLTKTSSPVYNRIGNDIEQITFFGATAERFATALKPLLSAPDSETRALAATAVLLVRPTRFGDVNRLAGNTGENTRAVLSRVESMPEALEVARALTPPSVTTVAANAAATPVQKVKLDEPYFRGYVQPILEKRGKDGYACVHCHSSHTLFNGSYSTALNVVNAAQPEQSLLLLKPTSTAESEGIAGSTALAHGGGVRFAKDSPEYVTILEWIKGAKE